MERDNMVLENIYRIDFLLERPKYAFILGVAFAVVGIFLALFLFSRDPALVAVGFISVLCMPLLNNISWESERSERFSLFFKWKDLYHNNVRAIQLYTFLFFGIFIVFAFFSIVLPSLATNHLFQQQLGAYIGSAIETAGMSFSTGLFESLLSNNLKVLLLCFVLALIAGSGSIFIIVWNASVWGTVFGNLAKAAASAVGVHPFLIFLTVMGSVLPHTILEALSYIIAAISGSVISQAINRERALSSMMNIVLRHNLLLLLIGVAVLLLGVLVETFVLNNVETYRLIINAAFGS